MWRTSGWIAPAPVALLGWWGVSLVVRVKRRLARGGQEARRLARGRREVGGRMAEVSRRRSKSIVVRLVAWVIRLLVLAPGLLWRLVSVVLTWTVSLSGLHWRLLLLLGSAQLLCRVVHLGPLAVLATPPPVRSPGLSLGLFSLQPRVSLGSGEAWQRKLLEFSHPRLGKLAQPGVGLKLGVGEEVLDVRVVRLRTAHWPQDPVDGGVRGDAGLYLLGDFVHDVRLERES